MFATGSINIHYLKPASVSEPIELQASVSSIKYDKKYTLHCDALVNGEKVADAQVNALLVWRSDCPEEAAAGFND